MVVEEDVVVVVVAMRGFAGGVRGRAMKGGRLVEGTYYGSPIGAFSN